MHFDVYPDGKSGEVHEGFSRRAGLLRAGSLLFLAGFSTGCYTTVPVASVPQPGQVLVMDLNDRGRVALGQSIGASATQVEGTLDSRTDSAYVVKVSSVVYMNGSSNRWTNEALTIQSDLVRELRERKFSRSRTSLVTVGAIGAVVAFIASRGLLGSGSPGTDKGGGDGSQQ